MSLEASMSLPSHLYDPLRIASALSPALFSLGDPDLLVELLNSNPAGVVLVEVDPDLPVVYCNESFQRWAPLGDRSILGRSLLELFVWADRSAVRNTYRSVIQTGIPIHRRSVPYRLRPQDQEAAQQRALSALATIARHLTSAGQAPSFFDELSATIAELVSAERVAFWLYDPDEETISAQPGQFGFSVDDLQLASRLPCRPGGTDPLERVVFDDLIVVRGSDVAVPWKAGDHRLGALGAYHSTRPSGFTDEDVRALQAAATAAALVWEHRQADDAQAEMRERETTSLRQQIEQSIELEHLKTDFLKLASHELRGPLGLVRGYISMMEDGTL